jgi:AraC-like DNA-binding protein
MVLSERASPYLDYLGFQLRKPSPVLQVFVRDYWFIRSYDSSRYREEFLHPNGGLGTIFNYGDDIFLDNQRITEPSVMDGANTFSRRLNFRGEVNAVGIRFKPSGAYPFFRMPINEIIDNPYDLAMLKMTGVHVVYGQLGDAPTVYDQVQILDRWLLNLLNENRLAASTVQGAMGMIYQSNGQSFVNDIGNAIGLSVRQLQRQYKAQVGISPKQHAKILRVEYARSAIKNLGQYPLSAVAYQAGYYDQSHFIREFKSIVSMTPSAYHARHQERDEASIKK